MASSKTCQRCLCLGRRRQAHLTPKVQPFLPISLSLSDTNPLQLFQTHSQPLTRPTPYKPTSNPTITPFLHYRQASTTPSTAPSKQGPPSQNFVYNIPEDSPTTLKIAREVRDRAKNYTETYIAYGATEKIYQQCAAQAEYHVPRSPKVDPKDAGSEVYETPTPTSSTKTSDSVPKKTPDGVEIGIGHGWWYHTSSLGPGLQPTFATWSQITMLHIYIFITRFRCFPAPFASAWQQHLLDHFFEDAERKMIVDHGLNLRSQRNRYLKDLHVQYRGILAAYDEGIYKGDAVLASALWRNVFAAREDVDLRALAMVTAHVRNSVRAMELIDDEGVVGGRIQFAEPAKFEGLVKGKSRWLEKPFGEKSRGNGGGEDGGVYSAATHGGGAAVAAAATASGGF